MRKRALIAILVCSFVFPAAGQSQTPDLKATQHAISRLDFMVGRWRGDAWQQQGGTRVETQMVETVERKLNGAVLLVEGRGTVLTGGTERVVHHALGVISFDPGSGTYTLRSFLATGQSGEFVLTLVDNSVVWTRQIPGGRIRNTARFTADEWHEIGEFSRDGTTWTQMMELKLKRDH